MKTAKEHIHNLTHIILAGNVDEKKIIICMLCMSLSIKHNQNENHVAQKIIFSLSIYNSGTAMRFSNIEFKN